MDWLFRRIFASKFERMTTQENKMQIWGRIVERSSIRVLVRLSVSDTMKIVENNIEIIRMDGGKSLRMMLAHLRRSRVIPFPCQGLS